MISALKFPKSMGRIISHFSKSNISKYVCNYF